MTVFEPEGEAQASTPPSVAAPAYPPPAYPPPAYPPPAYPPPGNLESPRSRGGMPWWAWVIIGGGVLLGLLVGASVLFALGGAGTGAGASPDYVGEPVVAADASATTIVSASETLAYDIPDHWLDAGDYVDLSTATSSYVEGTSLVGAHYTNDPTLSPAETILVSECAPEAQVYGDYHLVIEGSADGMRDTGAVIDEDPVSTPYVSPLGLEGVESRFTASYGDVRAEVHMVVVGHGKRAAIVQWIALEGLMDDAAFDSLMASVRLDS